MAIEIIDFNSLLLKIAIEIVDFNSLLLNMAIEIVDLSIKNDDFP